MNLLFLGGCCTVLSLSLMLWSAANVKSKKDTQKCMLYELQRLHYVSEIPNLMHGTLIFFL